MPRPSKSRTGRTGSKAAPATRLVTVDEVSAGGVVVDHVPADSVTGHAALIARVNRRGRTEWVLPKGHLEAGETAEQAAVREVREETGLESRVVAPLGDISYWFVADGQRIHKTVHHFLLEATGGELSDADVEVSEVEWVPLAEVTARLQFASERELVERIPLLGDTGAGDT